MWSSAWYFPYNKHSIEDGSLTLRKQARILKNWKILINNIVALIETWNKQRHQIINQHSVLVLSLIVWLWEKLDSRWFLLLCFWPLWPSSHLSTRSWSSYTLKTKHLCKIMCEMWPLPSKWCIYRSSSAINMFNKTTLFLGPVLDGTGNYGWHTNFVFV